MRKTYAFLLGAGAIGGALITGSFNALLYLPDPLNLVSAAAMILGGLLVIYYARFY